MRPSSPARSTPRKRRGLDRELFVATFASLVRERFPGCPEGEELRIATYACAKHTSRVGAMSFDRGYLDEAVDLAVVSHIRHRFTRYETWLARGLDRDEARACAAEEVTRILRSWSKPHRS